MSRTTDTVPEGAGGRLFMLQPREPSWWLWAGSVLLLVLWAAGSREAPWLLAGLSLAQIAIFGLQERRITAFALQVRIAYAGVVALAWSDPSGLLVWALMVGTTAQVVFGYCFLARTLSLLPWNRKGPLTAALVWRTFASPPRRGSVLQGQPPLRTNPERDQHVST